MWATLVLVVLAQGTGPGTNPAHLDRSGVAWADGFEAAFTRARDTDRMLLIVPDDHPAGDDGSMGVEAFRTAALCDPAVRNLVNRRFVPYYTNVNPGTAAHDPDALAWLVEEVPVFGETDRDYGNEGIPILIVTPKGKVVSRLAGNFPPFTARALLHMLDEHERYAKLTKAERKLDPLEEARLHRDLRDIEAARKVLKKDKRPEAFLLAAALAREAFDWRAHERALEKAAEDPALAEAVALERLRGAVASLDVADAEEPAIGPDSPDWAEARYTWGLACNFAGDHEAAQDVWKDLVEGRQELSPWIYLADLAHFCVERGTSGQKPTSSLPGRENYGYVNSPDLTVSQERMTKRRK